MANSMNPPVSEASTPLLSAAAAATTTTTESRSRSRSRRRSSSSSDAEEDSPATSYRFHLQITMTKPNNNTKSITNLNSHRSLAVLSGHVGSVSCLALCGEFILSASQAKDIIVWQQPDLRLFTKFGHGDGSVKALIAVGNRVFTAHQDSRIRVWQVSRSSENVFRLADTLPTTKDYLGKFMKQSNYVQTRRHHKRLWIQHADTISCLSFHGGLIYSGSWDKTLKVWRISDLKCLESIRAHDDAINALIASNGIVYSASADGKIKAWGKNKAREDHCLKGILEGHKEVSLNSVVVSEDGRVVYGGGSDGYVIGWVGNDSLDSWKIGFEVKAHGMAVLCLCLMGDEFLCTGSADKSIGIWRRSEKSSAAAVGLCRVGVIGGHEGPVKCLQASPVSSVGGGGFILYSGSLDKSLRVWWVPNNYSSGGGNTTTTTTTIEHKYNSFSTPKLRHPE